MLCSRCGKELRRMGRPGEIKWYATDEPVEFGEEIATEHVDSREAKELRQKVYVLAREVTMTQDAYFRMSHIADKRKELLYHVATSGVQHFDERIDYVEVQIDKWLWDELQKYK